MSTYRLQLTADFTLFDAAATVDYLAALGVGALYLSPLLQATRESTHGYDTVDYTVIDRERGGEAGFVALAEACSAAGLGIIVDIVPNHMGVAIPIENQIWWDVLRLGLGSAYAQWFDIDWDVTEGKVLLPVLGDDADLDKDLSIQDGELRYYEHRFPIAPGTESGSPTEVHDRQHYQLVNYHRADTEQNYRRFFAVTDLAAVRVEDPEVFAATHAEILSWPGKYGVSGMRIDHPDGLTRPNEYLIRLAGAAPQCWLLAEKITAPGERLPADWPVAGTTGYDALREINAVMIDPAAAGAMTALYCEFTGDTQDFDGHVAEGKRHVATTILRAESARIARLVPDIPNATEALIELAVHFDVYRSYMPYARERLDAATRAAELVRPDLADAIAALLPRLTDPDDEACVRFEQFTGAVMAKGVEDTAFYRYTRSVGLNEVGGSPGSFGASLDDFHAAQDERQVFAPEGMTTLSTHDTKRGEDIRARLAVLAEVPDRWAATVRELMDRAPISDPTLAYMLWQTVVALAVDAPADEATTRSRTHAYIEKAMREAASKTSWTDPQPAFEAEVHRAVDIAFDDAAVRDLITALATQLQPYARSNSLSQKVVQLTMPGIPDVYQGSEFWEDSLVDPDNRRPVDFEARRKALAELTAPPGGSDHLAKLWLTSRTLQARRSRPELFSAYTALRARGPQADHLIAFDRGGALTLATRLPAALATAGGWGETVLTLPPGTYRDAFTGAAWVGEAPVAQLLDRYPVALLLVEPAA